MAKMMNGFNFGTTMKKIFFAIIALAAFVGCNTEVMEEVATTPQYLTTSFEVDLNGESRAFNEKLEWSWTKDDQIAAYQVAGDKKVNILSLKENGKFGTEQFAYVPDVTADFVFVYPVEALNADKSLGYVQTGVWTPTLVGIVENATVNNIGRVDMTHMSAAFEIRVWDEGRQARKTIKAATITSELDFCDGNTATVSDINSDTVVFNIADGDFAFNLTLTATDGATYTVAVPAKNFENGQRTILNVEWKYPPTASYTVYSSYNSNDGSVSKNNGVDGRSIYVKNVAIQHYVSDAATLTLKRTYNGSALDDVALIVGQEWSANNLALGTYTFQLVLTDGDYTWSTPVSSIYVTGLPYTLNPAANDDWNAWSEVENVKWNNADRGTAVRIGYAFGTNFNTGESYIQKTFFVPENTTVVAKASGEVCGSGYTFVGVITTTYTYSVSGTTVGSDSQAGTESGSWYNKKYGEAYKNFSYSKEIIMTKDNPVVKHHNSNSTNKACTYVKSSQILYAE